MTREEAIQALNEIFDDSEFSRYEAWYGGAMDMAIEALSAEKTGEWIDVSGSWCANEECSLCGEIVHEYNYNYCPNCGAKMGKGGDTE